ncbi:hypothetical protein AJ79_09456 [Helicocarpus griseus UAMH5409]|uniref:Sister chromatid cohesion protein Ctf8 n=1 Tax=Helicocarpus griseus UAMH5409 TaxID=1447875 RepID=A0A2B7WB71_9EURO|nr:hypothetical protein AJ79_09456 [Helicocarpus griseus UAMH5409]
MPTIPLHPPSQPSTSNKNSDTANPIPQLLQTPTGLAILELQGTVNLPDSSAATDYAALDQDLQASGQSQAPTQYETPIGRLIFPDYDENMHDPSDNSWMKRVYLYVGRHQRLTGEVKKLPRPLAAIQRREDAEGQGQGKPVGVERIEKAKAKVEVRAEAKARAEEEGREEEEEEEDEDSCCDELQIVEVIKYKIIFSSRPEPVTDVGGDGL